MTEKIEMEILKTVCPVEGIFQLHGSVQDIRSTCVTVCCKKQCSADHAHHLQLLQTQ